MSGTEVFHGASGGEDVTGHKHASQTGGDLNRSCKGFGRGGQQQNGGFCNVLKCSKPPIL